MLGRWIVSFLWTFLPQNGPPEGPPGDLHAAAAEIDGYARGAFAPPAAAAAFVDLLAGGAGGAAGAGSARDAKTHARSSLKAIGVALSTRAGDEVGIDALLGRGGFVEALATRAEADAARGVTKHSTMVLEELREVSTRCAPALRVLPHPRCYARARAVCMAH